MFRLTGHILGQELVFERGTLALSDVEMAEATVDTVLGYISNVGMMLAEEVADISDEVHDGGCLIS